MGNGNDEQTSKRVAFYSSLVNAWVQTRMEVDKTLIVISSAGIGFLITLLTRNGGISCSLFLLYLAAFVSFFSVIVLCIMIFHRNSSYLEKVIKEDDEDEGAEAVASDAGDVDSKDDYIYLKAFDYLSKFFFALAFIFTLIIGIWTGLNQINK